MKEGSVEFSEWLRQELYRRGWDQQELVRRTDISTSHVSNVLNGMRCAGPDFCIEVARALGVPREVVFQARGWLLYTPKPLVAPDLPHSLLRMVETVRHLPPHAQDDVLADWARTLAMVCLLLGKAVEGR